MWYGTRPSLGHCHVNLSWWQIHAGIGLAMWALGAVFTGVSFNYGWLLFARIFTGAGVLLASLCPNHCRSILEHMIHAACSSGHVLYICVRIFCAFSRCASQSCCMSHGIVTTGRHGMGAQWIALRR